ncbi:MAG: hypothetical protein RL616_2014 [Verrucomicrobiota bacterium]
MISTETTKMKTILLSFICGESFGSNRPKRSLSPHEQQMRFFTVMFSAVGLVVFGVLFCLLNR